MNVFRITCLFLAWVSPACLVAQSIQEVRATARKDLQNAVQKLEDLRNRIEKEKIPLVRKVEQLERKTSEKRNELDRRLRLRDNRDANLVQLREEVKENEGELEISLGLLMDYSASWRQSTPSAEQNLWAKQISDHLSQSDNALDSALDSQLKILNLSMDAVLKQAGGFIFPGEAIVPPEGIREKGQFLSLGPTLFFSGSEGNAGFLEKSYDSDRFSSIDLTEESVLSVEPSRLLQTSEATSNAIVQALSEPVGTLAVLPLDPTMGKAYVMEGGEVTLVEELQKGGIWIYPILFFAGLSLLIAFYKGFQILSIPTPMKLASLEGTFSGPFETLRKTAKSYQGKEPEILEEILYEVIIDFQVKLEKALPLIAVTAATAPLLGLLGTVTGMIDVFRQITNFANPENSELARGISEALVTTKFGLITAIPALIAHALLSRRVQGVISKLEAFSARLVHLKRGAFSSTEAEQTQDASAD
ncbi:MAG: MotA/TolQ/ExbB proton channel family protein [Opitutales bacterium]